MWFFYGLSSLPFFVLYLISDFLAFLAGTIFKYRKRVILENLKKSFPEKTEQELEVITKGFYKNLSDIVVETIKGLTISQKELDRRVKIVNEDVLVKYLQGNTTNIALASHQGNWEWLLLSCASRLPVNVQAAYKPLRNQFFEKLM